MKAGWEQGLNGKTGIPCCRNGGEENDGFGDSEFGLNSLGDQWDKSAVRAHRRVHRVDNLSKIGRSVPTSIPQKGREVPKLSVL